MAALGQEPKRDARMAPALPLLSGSAASGDKIVHFAKVYQRAHEEEVFESLRDLSQELEQVARQHRKKLAGRQHTVAGGGDGEAANGVTAARVYAPDQLQLLLSTQDSGTDGATAREQTQQKRGADAKGKPMRRFMGSSISPFASALAADEAARMRHEAAVAVASQDGLYNKVQQIPWEDDIVWGIDFDSDQKAQREIEEDEVDVIEIENAAGVATMVRTPRAVGPRRFSVSAGHSELRNGYLSSAQAKPVASHTSSPSPRVPLTFKEMYPRAKTSKTETVWVPSAADAINGGEAFDTARPRHYRWEIADDESIAKASTTAGSGSVTESGAGLPCPLNKELQDDSWVETIGWNSTQDMPDSKLILDDNDASLIYSIPEIEDTRPTLRIPERKLGAAEQRLAQLDKQRFEKNQRIKSVMVNLEFGDDTAEQRLGTEGGGKKSKDTRVVKNIGYVHHSLPAIKLSLTKPELPKTKLREFHRPRGKFKINERLKFVPPPNVSVAPKDESTQIKKSSDLNPTAGGKLILIEYTEQNPPMLSNPGMAARILHYWRPPEDADAGMFGKKKAKKTRPKPPDMKMGQVITLGDHDESPFVGDIPAGRVVTSMNSKLYKVPIFPHKPSVPFAPTASARNSDGSELFLLCRSVTKSKKGSAIGSQSAKTTVYLMELPDVFLAGQVEPQIEVPAPNSRSANEFIRPYMSFHILRLFKKASDGERLKIEDIARAFPNQSGTAIRKRMKEVATFERGGNDSGWWKKKPASMLQSEEEIRASIQPESVCLYESMMSGHRRLLDIGLTKLFTPTGVNGAINHLLKRLELRKENLTAKLIEPLGLERRAREKAEQELWKKDPVIRKLEKDIQVARFINEQLQLTPWNLTNNYVECHLQGKGSGMLQLGGIGDPTGRGEGFSFVRVPQSRAKKKEEDETNAGGANADSAAVQKAVAAVTGTTADLRKLKMKEAGDVLRNLGLADADIKKLRRWDRIHMVRELSSRATAHGVAGSLSKFARGARKSLSAQQQEYRKKCDVIYERQMNVLSSTNTSFSSDEEADGDDDMDFDEWEKDLEADILGGTDTKRGPKNLFTKGGSGLNRSKEVLAEREDAVELRRLMQEMNEDSGTTAARRPDVNSTQLRNQLRASGIGRGTTGLPGSVLASRGDSLVSSAIATPTEHLSRASSPTHGRSPSETPNSSIAAGGRVPGRKVVKRTVRTIEEDGTETVRIEFIVDDKQVARFRAMQQRKERQQKAEERNQLRKRKRMLALEDNSASQSLLDKAKKRKQLLEELKQLQKTDEQNKGYQEMLEKQGDQESLGLGTPQKGEIRCTKCLQPGHMRTNRSCPLYMADDVRPPKKGSSSSSVKTDSKAAGGEAALSEPLKLKVKKSALLSSPPVEKITVNLSELREGARKHQAEKKRKRMIEVQEQAELYKRPYSSTSAKTSRSRMPVAHLNGNLEIVVFKLLEMPESELFRSPVDANVVKDYYQIIKHPMDLSRMKKKIDDLEYDSMRDFIKDLELMVSNSKVYNGDPARSLITANAVKVLKRAQEELASLHAEGGVATPTAGGSSASADIISSSQ